MLFGQLFNSMFSIAKNSVRSNSLSELSLLNSSWSNSPIVSLAKALISDIVWNFCLLLMLDPLSILLEILH